MTENIPTFPPVPFLAIFTLNSPIGTANLEIVRTATRIVEVVSGPFEVQVPTLVRQVAAGSAGATMGEARRAFPEGRYLAITTFHSTQGSASPYGTAALETSETASILSLAFRGLLGEQVFEDFVARPGQYVLIGAGPTRLVARPDNTPEDLARRLESTEVELGARSVGARNRFRLASRWFVRGIATTSLVDRLLCWYICLEVYPAEGTTDVPRAVRDFVHKELYPGLDPAVIKERLRIGPIASRRGDVVHKGQAHVTWPEDASFSQDLDKLELIVRACLCQLAGIPDGGVLDSVVLSPSAT